MKQLNGKKMIAASCIFHLPDTKEFLKDGAKNFLKSLLTLGTVKFNTVYVPTPLILAEDGLHVLELDKDLDVKNHYILETERLAEAKIHSQVRLESRSLSCVQSFVLRQRHMPCTR